MRVPFIRRKDAFALSGAVCLALTVALGGCASKNPLMEEPVARGTAPASPIPPAQQEQAASNTARAGAQASGTVTTESGVATRGPTGLRRILGAFAPYKIDIQQGNFVSREMVDQLKEGMTPDQVRFVLGTPLLNDIFHRDRWDYVFRLKKGSGEVIASSVTVFFDNGRLSKIASGELPTEEEYLAFIAGMAEHD